MKKNKHLRLSLLIMATVITSLLTACASQYPPLPTTAKQVDATPDYLIGPGDDVQIFVWRNPELSATVPVRPDGKITTPLIEDVPASGKTPTQLARDMEQVLTKFIREPVVTVIVNGFVGPYSQQVRVVGEAAEPQALAFREKMSLLDVMITVGGLTEFADGNKASVVRFVDGDRKQFGVRIEDLVRDGDITANVDMLPGDILIIPEAFF